MIRKKKIPDVIEAVCSHFGISPDDLAAKSQRREIVWPKHVAIHLCREFTNTRMDDLVPYFGVTLRALYYATESALWKGKFDDQKKRDVAVLREWLTAESPTSEIFDLKKENQALKERLATIEQQQKPESE